LSPCLPRRRRNPRPSPRASSPASRDGVAYRRELLLPHLSLGLPADDDLVLVEHRVGGIGEIHRKPARDAVHVLDPDHDPRPRAHYGDDVAVAEGDVHRFGHSKFLSSDELYPTL